MARSGLSSYLSLSSPRGLFIAGLTAGLLAIATGCQGNGSSSTSELVDSAGVRVVSYDLADVSVPTYRTVGARDLEIGVQDGPPEYTFSRITDLAVGRDRSIIVSDALAREVRVFSADGTHQGTVGRAGDGPGEFAVAPTFADFTRDTIVVFDSRARRISTFLTSGRLVAETSLPSDDIRFTSSVLRLENGSYMSKSVWVNPAAADDVHDMRLDVDSIVVTRLSASGAVLDTLRVLADRNRARSVEGTAEGFRTRQMTTPYSARAVVAIDGSRLVVGRSDDFALEWINANGRVDMIVRVAGVQHPATADDLRTREERILREDFGDDEIPSWVRLVFIESLPDRLPAFGNVVVAEGGNVWVSLTEFDLSEGLDWLVLSDEGELLGLVHTPPDFRLRFASDDFVVGYILDDLDVPYIHGYALTSGGTTERSPS